MAEQTKEIVKSKLVLWIDKTTDKTLDVDSYDDADAANMRAIALAQSYNLSQSGETEEITELASAESDSANPEVIKSSYNLSFDSLLLRVVASGGNYKYDDLEKMEGSSLAIGETFFWALTDFLETGFDATKVIAYGKGTVTGKEISGTVSSMHTYSVTIAGKGKVKEQAIPAAI